MKRIFIIPLVLILFCNSVYSQEYKIPKEVINFFIGEWNGNGEFANGKKISANLNFRLTLNDNWIEYIHTDELPNTYKSKSMWGIDKKTGRFVSYIFDSFTGQRKFESDGWVSEKLILSASILNAKSEKIFQHFIYEKLTENSFKMTFETSVDNENWKLIDYLIFTKKGI
jgi:hypothetical protein